VGSEYSGGLGKRSSLGTSRPSRRFGYANIPAAAIILIITALLARGTRESGQVNAVIVAIKLLIVLFFIVVGISHVDFSNFHLPAGDPRWPEDTSVRLDGHARRSSVYLLCLYRFRRRFDHCRAKPRTPGKDLPLGSS